MALQVLPEPMVQPAHKVRQVLMALQVLREPMVPQAHKVRQV